MHRSIAAAFSLRDQYFVFISSAALTRYLLQLSFLVHPDKNLDEKDRAQKAFEGEQKEGDPSSENDRCCANINYKFHPSLERRV